MKVFVNIKKAGSKRYVLNKVEYDMPFESGTLKDILSFFVLKEVERYNGRVDGDILKYLTEKEIADAVETGKVHFDVPASDRKADPDTAVENALLCFSDGLIRVFKNDTELESLDEISDIKENDTFTFVRLTFLTGRLW
ncbi:MAG: hypothetical protein MJ171_03600 [Clostridia bacterium]|nr:hypothetical protein [Clostridia bacterium]